MHQRPVLVCTLAFSIGLCAHAQQVPDSAFTFPIASQAYAKSKGPVVLVDEAHYNFHTLGGRYYAFGQVLAADGYVMKPSTEAFTKEYLAQARILVISNALPDAGAWVLPTSSAIPKAEREAVQEWVRNGGSLFLIADHMPFGGAAASLGRLFGFNWINGYALRKDQAPEVFSRKAGNLTANAITNGGTAAERIDSIAVFTGSAFLAPPEATVISSLKSDYQILLPTRAGEINDSTAYIEGDQFVNGAMLSFGQGRVVCFGEAAMFSAQRQGPDRRPMGMNQQDAAQDPQFLLNVIHWLDRRL